MLTDDGKTLNSEGQKAVLDVMEAYKWTSMPFMKNNFYKLFKAAMAQIRNGFYSIDDLEAECLLCVSRAALKYDPLRGASIKTYLSYGFRVAYLRLVRRHAGRVQIASPTIGLCDSALEYLAQKPATLSYDRKINRFGDDSLSSIMDALTFVEDRKIATKIEPLGEMQAQVNRLTSRDRYYLTRHFVEGTQLSEMAREEGLTRAAISLRVRGSLRAVAGKEPKVVKKKHKTGNSYAAAGVGVKCRHCRRRKVNRAHGLCWKCSQDPKVRSKYATQSKYYKRPGLDYAGKTAGVIARATGDGI